MKGYSLSLFQEPLHKVSLKESLFPVSARDRLLCLPEVHSHSGVVEMFFSEEWRELLKDFHLMFSSM